MKKIFLSTFLILSLNAQNFQMEKIRTDLYSKTGANVLRKLEISLEFIGSDLKENKNKLTDAVNTVISGFFYEDMFTEMGKNNFKKTLKKFLDEKYEIKLDDIYILFLSGIEKFDLEEFKRFLQSTETKEKARNNEVEETLENLELPQMQVFDIEKFPNLPNIKVEEINQLFKGIDEKNDNDNADPDIKN